MTVLSTILFVLEGTLPGEDPYIIGIYDSVDKVIEAQREAERKDCDWDLEVWDYFLNNTVLPE